MAFNGLEERFLARQRELYQGTSKNSGTAPPSSEPFVEFKPTDSRARETENDSRLLPIGSVRRDLSRVGNFLRSGDGVRFLASQASLQSGNAFAETRIYNPLFVIANVQPFRRFGRNLSNPSDFPVQGENKSPASTIEIGTAGRLQKNTADRALAKVMGGGSGVRSLLTSLLPQNIVRAVANTFSVARGGATGVDDRPEFRVNDTLYSIAVWQGFIKQPTPQSSLRSVRANLRVGNFRGAVNDLRTATRTFVRGVRSSAGVNDLSAPLGRNDPTNFDLSGRRYFITDAKEAADRYLRDSIGWDENRRPDPSLVYLDRKAKAIRGKQIGIPAGVFGESDIPNGTNSTTLVDAKVDPVSDAPPKKEPTTLRTIGKKSRKAQQNVRQKVQRKKQQVNDATARTVRKAIPDASGRAALAGQLPQVRATAPIDTDDNPAEAKLLFPELSLRQQYLNNSAIATTKIIADFQQSSSLDYWNQNKINRGFSGQSELRPGTPIVIDSNRRNESPSYLTDAFNTVSVYSGAKTDIEVSEAIREKIKTNLGEDLINVHFFDFVNKATIPFRAFVSNINESVMPEISDTKYIGRIDRNVVYIGVQREVSFQLRIHAMTSKELEVIWRKINYLTGLCYPSAYDPYGFMIPPFIKLTLGDVWRDQPGYIKSLSHTLEDGTPWEITDLYQAPHGITMNITFAILEKAQKTSKSIFYPVGKSRSDGNKGSFGQLPDIAKANAGTDEVSPQPATNPTAPTPTPARPSTSVAGGGNSRVVRPTIPPIAPDNTRVTPINRPTAVPRNPTNGNFRFGGGGGFSGGGGGSSF